VGLGRSLFAGGKEGRIVPSLEFSLAQMQIQNRTDGKVVGPSKVFLAVVGGGVEAKECDRDSMQLLSPTAGYGGPCH
jgi:hypothetical protein